MVPGVRFLSWDHNNQTHRSILYNIRTNRESVCKSANIRRSAPLLNLWHFASLRITSSIFAEDLVLRTVELPANAMCPDVRSRVQYSRLTLDIIGLFVIYDDWQKDSSSADFHTIELLDVSNVIDAYRRIIELGHPEGAEDSNQQKQSRWALAVSQSVSQPGRQSVSQWVSAVWCPWMSCDVLAPASLQECLKRGKQFRRDFRSMKPWRSMEHHAWYRVIPGDTGWYRVIPWCSQLVAVIVCYSALLCLVGAKSWSGPVDAPEAMALAQQLRCSPKDWRYWHVQFENKWI